MALLRDPHTFGCAHQISIIARGGLDVCDGAHSWFVMKKRSEVTLEARFPVSGSASQTDGVVAYIENQAAHHARRNMRESLSSCCVATAFLTIRRTCWVRQGPSLLTRR